MNKLMEVLENVLLPIADKLNNNRYLTALRDGFMVALPLIIFGSIFVVIANFPFLDHIISEEAFAAYQNALGPASDATLSFMIIFVIICFFSVLSVWFMVALPLIIFGSIFVFIAYFPFLDHIISEEAFAAYQNALGPASDATLSFMGIFVIIGIGYKLTEHYGGESIYG